MKLVNRIFFIFIMMLSSGALGFEYFSQNCPSGCSDSADPLSCGSLDFQFQAGLCPIKWKRADQMVLSPFASFMQSSILTLFENPRFSAFYHTPWIIGMQVGYAWGPHVRIYGEVNYVQTKAKYDVGFFTDSSPSIPASITFSKYTLCDAYLGGRYYSDRCCSEQLSCFLGGKIGIVRHHSTTFDLLVGLAQLGNQTALVDVPAFNHRTSVSGGINGGIDICCDNWSLVITGEVVISKGPATASDIAASPAIFNTFAFVYFGDVGTELRFPITAGIRYTF